MTEFSLEESSESICPSSSWETRSALKLPYYYNLLLRRGMYCANQRIISLFVEMKFIEWCQFGVKRLLALSCQSHLEYHSLSYLWQFKFHKKKIKNFPFKKLETVWYKHTMIFHCYIGSGNKWNGQKEVMCDTLWWAENVDPWCGVPTHTFDKYAIFEERVDSTKLSAARKFCEASSILFCAEFC